MEIARVGEGDLPRYHAGRPVNFNAFIPDDYPQRNPGFKLDGAFGLGPFGWSPSATRLSSAAGSGGVDPQMIYCASPLDPQERTGSDSDVTASGAVQFPFGAPSGWAGGSISNAAPFHTANSAYQNAMAEAWAVPPKGEPFCRKQYDNHLYLVWRSFCDLPERVSASSTDFVSEWSSLKSDSDFMTMGRVPNDRVHVAGDQVAKWVRSANGKGAEYTQMLFDLRNGNSFDFKDNPKTPFQYPLSERNITDALELACYANSVQQSSGINCDTLTLAQAKTILANPDSSVAQMGAIVECYGRHINEVVDRLVFAPAPSALVTSFAKGVPLPTSGLGGAYLTELSNQYRSLVRVRQGLRMTANAYIEIAAAARDIELIQQSKDYRLAAYDLRKFAAGLTGLAQAASSLSAENLVGGSYAAAGLYIAAAGLEIGALHQDANALESDAAREVLAQKLRVIHAVESVQTSLDDVNLAANELTESTDNLRSSQKRAARAKSRIDWSGWAGEEGVDAQFVNTATRRIYNTRLHRYETALARAKKLAFIARRAIELRFGVDLQRQVGDLTLVEAPAKWANDVCEMQGINYAEIRDPANTIGTGEQGKFDFTNDGENFATSYIGEYIAKLEDFVNTYPFDYPLKEGDDVAVLSVADDIFGVTPACPADGRNDLYYSTEFDQRSTEEPFTPETVGWGSGGCDRPVSTDDGTPWDGCVLAERVLNPPGAGGGSDIPAQGEVYRIKNAGCFQDDPSCPPLFDDEPYYPAVGYRGQDLRGLSVGWHLASVYVHGDPRHANSESPGAHPYWRIVDSGGGVVAEAELWDHTLLEPPSDWQRNVLPFYVTAPGDYRLEVYPTDPRLPVHYLNPDFADEGGSGLRGEDWDSFLVASAQVERVVEDFDGALPAASAWVRTGINRTTETARCNELRGAEMRKRFERKCEFVCSDGIHDNCAAQSPDAIPTEVCFYEAQFAINLEQVESGDLIPSGQLAIGNFNLRHNLAGVNFVGTGVTDCSHTSSTSCYYNGFAEYSLTHDGSTRIRAHDGSTLAAHMQTAYIEHGKALATERVLTNPPSSNDGSLIEPYMKGELKGRPIQGLYTLRIWDDPGLRWEQLDDIQLYWRYHYWTRFKN